MRDPIGYDPDLLIASSGRGGADWAPVSRSYKCQRRLDLSVCEQNLQLFSPCGVAAVDLQLGKSARNLCAQIANSSSVS